MQIVGFRFVPIPASAAGLALEPGLTRAMYQIGLRCMNMAVIRAPRATGFLASQHRVGMAGGSGGPIAVLENLAPYASAVHEGTRAHEIVPVNATVLRFTIGGVTIFASRVWHPGTHPQPWLWISTVDRIRQLSSSSEVLA